MKKYLFLCLLFLSLILCLTACSNSKNKEAQEKAALAENNTAKTNTTSNAATTSSTTPSSITADTESKQPVTETVDRQIIDWTDEETIDIMKTYQSVLHDETDFFDVYYDKTSTFSQMIHTMDDRLSLGRFAVIDLDGDNRMEFIISIDSGELHDIVFLIFHYEDKKVYNYTLAYKEFEVLKIDGTFNFSGGHTNHGIGTLSFQKGSSGIVSLITDDFTYIADESTDDESESGLSVSYYVNHALSTKTEFDKALTTQENKRDVTWYDFTEENIKDFFQIP